MENVSKTTIDDSSCSMYFSFNSTAYKTHMESTNDNSMALEDEECDQNNTLEADEANQPVEETQTIKKLSFGVSPPKAIPKNILKVYKALSSTPTKAQLLRSVEVNRGSAAVDVGDLGLAFLEAPQESINAVLSEDKENQPQESQELIYSETSSEIVVSVIEKTQEEEKPIKRVGFSNLPILKISGNSNIREGTPKVRRSIPKQETVLAVNRPSRISTKRMSSVSNTRNEPPKVEYNTDEIPKMISSILKISKGLPSNRKSIGNVDNPFNLVGKATRMSIVKTTLNSPARKVSRMSLSSGQVGKNSMRLSNLQQINKAKSIAAPSIAASVPSRSVIPINLRKSIVPPTVTSPKKRIISSNSRKSCILPITSSRVHNARKSIASKTPIDPRKNKTILMKPPSNLKEDLVCDVCSRKFLVLSLFEAHKRTHNKVSSSASYTKQTFSSGNDNKCTYCDKKFAIAKALENHLIQNCTKIPPGHKKKLLFPTDQPIAAQSKTKLPPKSMSNLSSCDSISSNATQLSRSQLNVKNSVDGNINMAPLSSNNKLKKKLAHSGVYCTPNKQIMCHICKTSFNNILAFTKHKLSHSNAGTDDSDSAIEVELAKTQISVECDGKQQQQMIESDVPLI